MAIDTKTLDELCVNTIRTLSIDAVQKAKSGHPGMPMGAAAMAYVLWMRHLRYNPKNSGWLDRDRFVLSAGHGSMLLYSLLHLTGYDLSMDDLRQFRQWGSRTPGHPERHCAPGVEVSTGPLGQGAGNSVGMAIAERWLAATFNRPGHSIVDHYTYAITSDGDLMEGVAAEAASLAGHLRLGRLIWLYDANLVTLSATTSVTYTEDVGRRFEGYGWHVQHVADGNDLAAVDRALTTARAAEDHPSLVIVRTHLGYGSPHRQDTFQAHGEPLGDDEVRATKRALGWPEDKTFYVPDEALRHFREAVPRGAALEEEWGKRFDAYRGAFPDLARAFGQALTGGLPEGWESALPAFGPGDGPLATREASGKIMNAIAASVPTLIGGSADLDPSTHTMLKGAGDFESPAADGSANAQGRAGGVWDYAGRNVHFGIREHAMGAALNGMAAHGGVRPFGATFLVFSDYMRPSVRLAALSELPVIYVWTHDSVALGEDGPTHEPVEQLASLRAIPNLLVLRPADANETAEAWRVALRHTSGPVALVLTRQKLPVLDRTSLGAASGTGKGGYVLADAAGGSPDTILIATGSEVALALEAHARLTAEGIRCRVVSLPCWELFEAQPEAYRDSVVPPAVRARVTVEAAASFGWERYARDGGVIIGLNRFGASAPGPMVMRELGFTVERVVAAVKAAWDRTR
ncbi:MAG TPA: transketolase [bacterium]|nr:transketolase [bacterium]